MLMQNFGGTTKSIMVFLKKAYRPCHGFRRHSDTQAGVWKSRKPESGIGMGTGTGTGTGTGNINGTGTVM